MMRSAFHIKIHHYTCILIAFFLPVYIHIVPLLIILLSINWVIEGNFQKKINCFLKNKLAWLSVSLYIVYFLGMLWTENSASGWFDLQVKLSLLIFPLIISTSENVNKRSKKKLLQSFMYGCLTGTLICFGYASYRFYETGQILFAYNYFSIFLHPSYLSMYLLFGIVIIFFNSGNSEKMSHKAGKLFLSLILCAVIILLSSKIGFISLLMFLLFYVVYVIRQKKQWKSGLLLVGFTATFLCFVFYFFPFPIERIKAGIELIQSREKIDTANMNSNTERLLIWKSSIDIIKNKFLYGTGTGDSKDELIRIYNQKGYHYLSEHNLNAHNQFLQTTIAVGVGSGILLLLNFIIPFWISIKKRKILLALFLTIVFLNFLVESMLETQAGVIFYAFFNSLFLFGSNSEEN